MMSLWTTFARTGVPTLPEHEFKWPAYDQATDQYLLVVDPPTAKAGYSRLVSAIPTPARALGER